MPFVVAWVLRLVAIGNRGGEGGRLVRSATAFGAVFVVTFLAVSPYVLIDWSRFVRDTAFQRAMFEIGHGAVSSKAWWQHATVTLPAALGWPVFVAGVVGTALLLVLKWRETAVLLAFPIAYYAFAGSGYEAFARYMIPVLPFLSIAASWLCVTTVRKLVGTAAGPVAVRLSTAVVATAMAAPSGYEAILLDRLLTETDNRVVAVRTLAALVEPGSRVYQSGSGYGQVPFALAKGITIVESKYDEAAGQFTPDPRLPDWVVLQRSPLVLYSYTPPALERLVREQYDLIDALPTESRGPRRVYDQQDAFFLPLAGLTGIKRPGPAFEFYRLRGASYHR